MADTTSPVYGLTLPGNLDPAGAGLWGPKISGDMTIIDTELSKPRIIKNAPIIGATTTFDLSLARVFTLTVTQITTVAFTNVPTSSFSVRIRILLTNGNAFAVTWPASVSWLSGTTPTFKTAGVDAIEMETVDGGTTWYATLRGDRRFQPGTAVLTYKTPLVLFNSNGNSTTSVAEVSLASFLVKANSLAVDGEVIRVRMRVSFGGGGANWTFKMKLGITDLLTVTASVATRGWFEAMIKRTGAAAQTSYHLIALDGTVTQTETTAAISLTADATLDFRGNVSAGATPLVLNMATAVHEAF